MRPSVPSRIAPEALSASGGARRLSWSAPGLCENGARAASQARRKAALLRTFRTEDSDGLAIAHDETVPGDALATIRLAIGRTAQVASDLLGWTPTGLPPAIYVYRSAEELRAVACVNAGSIAYYDGSLHLSGDPRYTTATLTREAAHEYVHHILVTMGISRPTWLHEGLAMQIAEERWWRRPGMNLQAWLEQQRLPFESLVDGLAHAFSDDQLATAAYYQSYMMVGFVRQRRGPAYLRELAAELASGRTAPEEAFARAAAVPAGASLDAEWDRYVRTHRDPASTPPRQK
jgi:hypothetical protein